MALTTGRVFAINLLANSKPAENAFERVGKAAGRLPTPLKVAAAAVTAVFAAVTAVAIKSFSELLKLGEEFNEVTRIISVGTGAVGGDLAALEQSFRNVAGSVPNAFAEVATVIAELDTRTDLAGEGLEAMAEQMLTLARLTGGDVLTTTRQVTRLFNRFGLSAEDASDMLDLLFRASQASGAGVDKLAEDVTKNAGALGAMGLSLEESIALIALFEREGVRTRTVVSALQTGFLKLTKDGALPLNEALATTFEELQTLDREAAVAKGLEIFGTSALELVDAVRDGRLSVEDFTRQIADGESTILGVAEETDGWRVKLDELKNFLKLKFEGPATAVFDGLTEVIEGLIPAAERVEEAYSERGLAGALEQVKVEWNRIYEEDIKPIWLNFLQFLDETIKPLAIELGKEIGAAIADGISTAALEALSAPGSALGQGALDAIEGLFGPPKPPPQARRPGESISDFIDRQEADSGRPPTPRPRPLQLPKVPTTPSRFLEYAPGMFAQVALADGGIVTSPTLALIGEAGPEAVVPLNRAGSMGATVNITVNGALDAEGVARQIRRVLQDAERRSGVRVLS